MLEQVGKYEIEEEIGHGGMATVYRARDNTLRRLVALKVMHPHLQGTAEARARFEREALSVARLHHPSILEIYDYSGDGSDMSYIATELLTGPTLREFADRYPEVPAEIAACLVIGIARALSAAHEEGIIHRDVKPENIMIHEGGVKLTDFGIAQLVDTVGMTTTGQVLGSPGHMAPEQIEGRDCNEATDLFSLGTVLYLLATGELPFTGSNPHAVLKRIVEGRFRDPLEVRGSISGELRGIIRRCLDTDPEQRYASAGALADDLQAFVGQMGIDDPKATLREYLQAPAEFSDRFRGELIESLTERGERAQASRKLPVAMDHFNRVLALDDGNERVLAAVQRLGRRSRMRRASLIGFGLLTAVGLAFAVLLRLDAGGDSEAVVVRVPEPGPIVAPSSSPAPPSASTVRADAPKAGGDKPVVGPLPGKPKPRGRGPRQVEFKPIPQNVSISVDGAAPRAFGPSFHGLKLQPGEHTFRFTGAHDCCVDAEVKRRIPPGPGTTTIIHRLQFKPAGLYVAADRAANVSVDDGAVAGRARNVLQVPHRRAMVQAHSVRVSAEGFRDHVQQVNLRAGQVKTLDVRLTPIAVLQPQPDDEAPAAP